jgi:glycosyltransferase involved in cell wall biosynthesis
MSSSPKIAIVCDWLTDLGGAERVILALHQLYPDAPIYTSIYNRSNLPQFGNADVRTSFLQKMPGAKKKHQRYLAQMPLAFESFDLDEFDVVISSSHSCAKGIITKPDTLHISYCHSPPRYLWDGSHQYVKEYPWPKILKKTLIPSVLHDLRVWDRAAADRVDLYVANSHYVSGRIKKYYRRKSEVIHPPVELEPFVEEERDDYYLAVGRLIPYKRFDLIIDAFNQLKRPLKVIGVGNQLKKLQKMASPNIEFLGMVPEDTLRNYYQYAKALIFPQVEDFGITPLEAMGHGCPVIAYGAGGALETVKDNESGLFFNEQSTEALVKAVEAFEHKQFDPQEVRGQAEKFESAVFAEKLSSFVDKSWDEWRSHQ